MSQKLESILRDLELAVEFKKNNRAIFFAPYPKQKLFFDYGATKRERLFMAGNQVGKSEAGAFETACHLTGNYPDWWAGRKFNHPVRWWAAGETSSDVRDIQQRKLCGSPGVEADFGTGMIQRKLFVDRPSLARGATDAYDTIQVRHATDGINDGVSILRFKSYEQGRKKFQGDTLDGLWWDEEPDDEIYSEGVARLTGRGITYMTFTPLQGMSKVVKRFLDEPSPDRTVVRMGLADADHFTAEEKEKRLAGYQAHERKARADGEPLLGSGAVFTMPWDAITEDRIEQVPVHWAKIWGIDFGIGHPFAAALILWDREADVIHVHHCIRMVDLEKMSLPIHHAAAMKPIGAAIPVAWPQDGTAREKGSGDPLAALYKKEGLRMLPDPAMWPDGGNSTEAGIVEMDDRMRTGRLKIASHLSDWFAEYRNYHRKDGQIVKLDDDLLSATRVAIMAKRFAQAIPLGGGAARRHPQTVAEGIDFDIFAA